LTDQQLQDRFDFIEEIGFGNWGSVWKVKPVSHRRGGWDDIPSMEGLRLGRAAAAAGGGGAGGRVAVKLVHRCTPEDKKDKEKAGVSGHPISFHFATARTQGSIRADWE
jgi:hypothetical protein